MKHRPQLPDDTVNVAREHPLRELARLAIAFAAIAVALFFVSGWLVDVIVDRLDPDTGAALRPQITQAVVAEFGAALDTPHAQGAQTLFQALLAATGRDADAYRLLVLDNETVNAVALPGGLIVVFAGLLDQVESQNELAMILGHELGHLDNKDHLRLLGRGMLWAGASMLVFGNANALDAQLLSLPNHALQMRFGRSRELAADVTGLETVCTYYGHSGGAVDFFARHLRGGARFGLFASHPASAQRIEELRALAKASGCAPGATESL